MRVYVYIYIYACVCEDLYFTHWCIYVYTLLYLDISTHAIGQMCGELTINIRAAIKDDLEVRFDLFLAYVDLIFMWGISLLAVSKCLHILKEAILLEYPLAWLDIVRQPRNLQSDDLSVCWESGMGRSGDHFRRDDGQWSGTRHQEHLGFKKGDWVQYFLCTWTHGDTLTKPHGISQENLQDLSPMVGW